MSFSFCERFVAVFCVFYSIIAKLNVFYSIVAVSSV